MGFLGLNRDELKKWRYEVYELAMLLVAILRSARLLQPERQRTEDRLRRMTSTNGEFAGMVRFFVRDVEGLNF